MGPAPPPDTDALLRQASEGDKRAVEELLERHRPKLRQMVTLRMDPRLAARVDPSDVVQEGLTDAFRKLPAYLRDRPMPFYPWLRHLTWQRLVDLHRLHLHRQKRSVSREEPNMLAIPDESARHLAKRLVASQTSPSSRLLRRELRQRVRAALDRLSSADREVLILMYLEQLSTSEISAILELSEKAVTMRHLRALERLRPFLRQ